DVGAPGLLAHRVQPLVLDQRVQFGVLRPHLRPDLDPRRLLLDGGRAVAGFHPQQPAALGSDAHNRPSFRFACGAGPADAAQASANSGSAGRPTALRWLDAPSTAARWCSVAARMSPTRTSRPSSALREVTPASEMPQGTIRSNHDRSLLQFTANPCIVTPRATRQPIAAILRSGRPRPGSASSHTPARPSTRVPARPKSPITRMT